MASLTADYLTQFSFVGLAAGYYGIRQLRRRRPNATAETFSRIRCVTCVAPSARCTLTSYSGHSVQLRLRRQTDVHISSSERCSNAMSEGKAGILTTKETADETWPASSQSSWPVPEPGSYVRSTETPSFCIATEQRTHQLCEGGLPHSTW
jgi:hypothetical protein